MKWVKCISLTLLLLLIILFTMIYWIVNTQSGLHVAINSTVRCLPGLEIATINGGWNDVNLQRIRYRIQGMNIAIDKFHISWTVNCLNPFKLYVNNISTEGVNVNIDNNAFLATKNSANLISLPSFVTTFMIFVQQLTLKNINIQINDTNLTIAELSTAAYWQANSLNIKFTTINGLAVHVPPKLVKDNHIADQIITPIADVISDKSPGERLKAIFAQPFLTQLPDFGLPIDIHLEHLQGLNWDLGLWGKTTTMVINHLTLVTTVQNKLLIAVKQMTVTAPEGTINMNGYAHLVQHGSINISVQAESYLNHLHGQKLHLKLDGALLHKLKLILHVTGPINAHLVAEAALSQSWLPIKLTIYSPNLNWPLQGESKYHCKDLFLRFNSHRKSYSLSLQTNIDGLDLHVPPTLLRLDAQGNEKHVLLTSLRLNTLQGQTKLTGIIDCNHHISWHGVLTFSNINTSKQWPQWPVKLHGKIITTGSIHGGGIWQFKIATIRLDGNVKGHLLRVRGTIMRTAAGQWSIPVGNILLGRNQLAINKISNMFQLNGIIEAPFIEGVLPGFSSGIIKGNLNLSTTLTALKLTADIAASNVQWQDHFTLNHASIKCDISYDQHIQGQFTFAVHQLQHHNIQIHNINIMATGHEQRHFVKMYLNDKRISGYLTLQGSFDRKKQLWQGSLDHTLFKTLFGEWQLSRAVAIEYANTQQQLIVSPHCWFNTQERLCLSKKSIFGKSGHANILLQNFDLSLIQPLLSPDIQPTGRLSGNAKISWGTDVDFAKIQLNCWGRGVKINKLIEGLLFPVPVQTLTFNADISHGQSVFQWFIQIPHNGKFSGKISINFLDKISPLLSGYFSLQNISSRLMLPIFSKMDRIDGSLNADLRLSGNLKQPRLNGDVALTNITAQVYWLPFNINHGWFTINFMGTGSQLRGYLKTPEAALNFIGTADWHDINTWKASISATGTTIPISFPPMISINVEPDIIFDITPKLLIIHGNINIPWARIQVQELPESSSLVGVSLDEIMLDANVQNLNKKDIPILTNVTINIGHNVHLDAFGLKAQLTGRLNVIQDKKIFGLNGQLDMKEGRFRKYGQDLLVRKGQLLFSGPVDKPLLNFEAIRNPESTNDNIIAGVRVTGFANKPKINIFSEPVTLQEEALSYLLRGEGLDRSRTNLATVLINLGISHSVKFVSHIGELLKISDLSFYTQGVGNQYQVVLSGKIINNLQIQYSVGILNLFTTLTLRYCLMSRLYLEAVYGLDQTLDLLYQFDF